MLKPILTAVLFTTTYAIAASDPSPSNADTAITAPSLLPLEATDTANTTDIAETTVTPAEPHTSPLGQPFSFNPIDPAFLARAINPDTHHEVHAAFANPAQYKQMMQPQFYMQMMNPAIMAKWMQPETYTTLMSPEIMVGWMNPKTFEPMVNPATYSEMMNPAAILELVNPANMMQTALSESANTNSVFEWFKTAMAPIASLQSN